MSLPYCCTPLKKAHSGIRYIYLVERIHVVRAPFVKRRKDKIYLSCMTMVVVMYGAVAINAYINNYTHFGAGDNLCYFGIRRTISIPFTVVNVFTDLVLTATFFYLLRPIVSIGSIRNISRALRSKRTGETTSSRPTGAMSHVQRSIKILLRKVRNLGTRCLCNIS